MSCPRCASPYTDPVHSPARQGNPFVGGFYTALIVIIIGVSIRTDVAIRLALYAAGICFVTGIVGTLNQICQTWRRCHDCGHRWPHYLWQPAD